MDKTRKPYTAPKLTEHGRVERLTLMPRKTIGLTDGYFLVQDGGPDIPLADFS